MKRYLIAALLGVSSQCTAITGLAAEVPGDFAYAMPLSGTGNDALYRVVIPPAVYDGSAFADLRDLRVFNGADEVVPHAFRPLAAGSEQPPAVSVPFFALRGKHGTQAADLDVALETNNGDVSLRVTSRGQQDGAEEVLGYLIDLSSRRETFSSLQLQWDSQPGGYIGTVDVEASKDLKHWSYIVRNAPLLNLSQGGHQLEQNLVPINTAGGKYLRLTWPETGQALRLNGVHAQPADKRTPLTRASRQVEAVHAPRNKGDYIADVGGMFPVDRLTIRLPQDNSVAPIEIFSRNTENAEWRRVSRTIAYRLRQDNRTIENATVRISPRAHRYWLFRVNQQGGGIGAGNLGVELGWLPHEIIFTARGPGPFRLAYGNGRAQGNALPVQTLVPNWGSDSAPEIRVATAGAPLTLAGPEAARQRADPGKVGLWIALFASVAVLGFMAWRISRQMQAADAGSDVSVPDDPGRRESGKE
jgi:hypothetical protein